jgi:hypothetical protein
LWWGRRGPGIDKASEVSSLLLGCFLLLKECSAPGFKVLQRFSGLLMGLFGCGQTLFMLGEPFLQDVEAP